MADIGEWMASYESEERDERLRGATGLVAQHGAEAPLPILLEILDDLHAAGLGADTERVLRRRKDPELLDEMVKRLHAPSVFVQGAACGVLGELGDKRATPHLVEALGSSHLMTRRAAGFALAELADPESEAGLRRAYDRSKDDDPNVRTALECALHAVGAQYDRHPN